MLIWLLQIKILKPTAPLKAEFLMEPVLIRETVPRTQILSDIASVMPLRTGSRIADWIPMSRLFPGMPHFRNFMFPIHMDVY